MTEDRQPSGAARIARRTAKAESRRESESFIIPLNAMVPLSSLPAKTRHSMAEEMRERGIVVHEDFTDEDKELIMVPDPRCGMKLHGHELTDRLVSRRLQQAKIDKKRRQRRDFAQLSATEKRFHREAGLSHEKPSFRLITREL
jgi:hypothetical protein